MVWHNNAGQYFEPDCMGNVSIFNTTQTLLLQYIMRHVIKSSRLPLHFTDEESGYKANAHTYSSHLLHTHSIHAHSLPSHFSFQSYSCWVTNWNSARLQETDHVVLQAVSDPAGRQHWWDGCHSEIQWVQERVQTKTNRGVLWWTQGRGLVSDFVISRGLFVGRDSCSCAHVCVCVCVGVDTMFSVWQFILPDLCTCLFCVPQLLCASLHDRTGNVKSSWPLLCQCS